VYGFQISTNYGLTGVMARCVGIRRDLRLLISETYASYYYLNFRSYLGFKGDSYDRYLIRMNEMCESINIINQSIDKVISLPISTKNIATYNSIVTPHSLLKYLNTNL
jgi:NADH:ubiquinone oxidoreductase subunit D